jgi:hypothetical protein
MWDWAGQLGESGEYWMGRLKVVWYQIQSSKVIALVCVDWGPIVWPRWIRLIIYWRIHDLWGPVNLVASTVTELDNTPLYFMGDSGIVWGPPTDARWGIAWKTYTRVRWAQLDSLIVVVNYGHSWFLYGSRVSCCQVVTLQSYIDSILYNTLRYGWCLFTIVIL